MNSKTAGDNTVPVPGPRWQDQSRFRRLMLPAPPAAAWIGEDWIGEEQPGSPSAIRIGGRGIRR
jgi:hypothetical protein